MIYAQHMVRRNGQLFIAVFEQAPAQEVRIDVEVIAAQVVFNGHFPEVDRAEEQAIGAVFNKFFRA